MTKTKCASLFIIAAASIAFCAGCSKDAATNETENIDLTQVPDLFEDPLKPNPLAPQADDVIVTVEGQDITHGEIMQAVQTTMRQLSRQMPPQQLSQMYGQMYKNMTDQLIANVLLTKAAENSDLTVSDEELNEEIEKIKAGIPEDGKTLEEALAENNIDIGEWKEEIRKRILLNKLVEEKTADIAEATAAEVAAFYQENMDQFKSPEKVEASHILLSFSEEDTDETKADKKAKLEKIKADIAGGASFEDLATENSDCPSSQRGGSLGSFARGQMVPEFEQAAFTQEVGTVGDIVETQFGYHLIKVTDHQPESTNTLAEVTDRLQDYLTGQKKQKAVIAYIDTLREKADIVMHKQDLDSGAAEAPAE